MEWKYLLVFFKMYKCNQRFVKWKQKIHFELSQSTSVRFPGVTIYLLNSKDVFNGLSRPHRCFHLFRRSG